MTTELTMPKQKPANSFKERRRRCTQFIPFVWTGFNRRFKVAKKQLKLHSVSRKQTHPPKLR